MNPPASNNSAKQGPPAVEVGKLAARAQGGDHTAFDRLVNHFWSDIVRLVYYRTQSSMDAEDLAQEIFLKAFRSIGSLRQPERFKPWLFRIAVNKVKDHHRKRRLRSIFTSLEGPGDEPSPEPADRRSPSPLDQAARRQFWRLVGDFCAGLPRREREVFTLRFLDQLTIGEIAQVLGRSQSAVKTHLYRAVAKFQKKPALTSAIRGLS